MAFNWQITVGAPTLTTGMSFVVRYKKEPAGAWVNHLPNPTTNTFIIPSLDEGKYTAEIRLICLDGSISTPKYIQTNCGDQGTAPLVNIFWYDLNTTEIRNCQIDTIYPIGYESFDADNDIVLIELQRSLDGLIWNTESILATTDDFVNIDANTLNSYQYRFKVTDNQNNVSLSNILQINCPSNLFSITGPDIDGCYTISTINGDSQLFEYEMGVTFHNNVKPFTGLTASSSGFSETANLLTGTQSGIFVVNGTKTICFNMIGAAINSFSGANATAYFKHITDVDIALEFEFEYTP